VEAITLSIHSPCVIIVAVIVEKHLNVLSVLLKSKQF
jgi:hypothetical protein